MDIAALKAELAAGHPDTGAYTTGNPETAAAELNAVNRTKNKSSLTGDEMFDATVIADWSALTDHQQQLWGRYLPAPGSYQMHRSYQLLFP